MRLTIENYMTVQKVYISMMNTVNSKFVKKQAKWGNDKLIYDA